MASIQFTDADRDERGFVAVSAPARNPEPRSLADLLPAVAAPPDQTIKRSPPTKAEWVSMIVMGLLFIGLFAWLWRSGVDPRPAPQPRPAATQASGDSAAKPSPIPATPPAVAGRLLIAFASPDGFILGAIESTRAITPTAHYGDSWIQADVHDSGLVWLRASDAPDLAIVGPDLAPRPTRAPAVVIATATPEPQPPCLTAGTGMQTVTVCDWLDSEQLRIAAAAKWADTFGGNIGTVATPSPQIGQ